MNLQYMIYTVKYDRTIPKYQFQVVFKTCTTTILLLPLEHYNIWLIQTVFPDKQR